MKPYTHWLTIGSIWKEPGIPERLVKIEDIHEWRDDEYKLPLRITIKYRTIGTMKNGKPFPLVSSCISAFMAPRYSASRTYNTYPRFVLQEPIPATGEEEQGK